MSGAFFALMIGELSAVALGSGSSTGTTVSVSSTSANAAAGALIAVVIGSDNAAGTVTITGVTDSAGNTYSSTAQATRGTATLGQLWFSHAASPLPAGSTITATLSGTATPANVIAAMVLPAVTAKDVDAGGASFNSTSHSVTTGALNHAIEDVAGFTFITGGNHVYTESPGFRTVVAANDGGTRYLFTSFKRVESTSSVTYTATLGGGAQGVMNAVSFN